MLDSMTTQAYTVVSETGSGFKTGEKKIVQLICPLTTMLYSMTTQAYTAVLRTGSGSKTGEKIVAQSIVPTQQTNTSTLLAGRTQCRVAHTTQAICPGRMLQQTKAICKRVHEYAMHKTWCLSLRKVCSLVDRLGFDHQVLPELAVQLKSRTLCQK